MCSVGCRSLGQLSVVTRGIEKAGGQSGKHGSRPHCAQAVEAGDQQPMVHNCVTTKAGSGRRLTSMALEEMARLGCTCRGLGARAAALFRWAGGAGGAGSRASSAQSAGLQLTSMQPVFGAAADQHAQSAGQLLPLTCCSTRWMYL